MNIQIMPKDLSVPKIAYKVKIYVTVILDEKAVARVEFYDNSNYVLEPLDVQIVLIEGDEYRQWGQDDNYIYNLVFEKLGLTPTEVGIQEIK